MTNPNELINGKRAEDLTWDDAVIDPKPQKLAHATLYFKQHADCEGDDVRLYKMLSFLDFENYRQVGKSVTGLTYIADDRGPVPECRLSEVKLPQQLDMDYFDACEIEIMEFLTTKYKNKPTQMLVDDSHAEGTPWQQTYREGHKDEIKYDAALADKTGLLPEYETISEDEVRYLQSEYSGFGGY